MDVSYNGCDTVEYLEKLNNLIKAVETTLKECNRKYKNKLEIDNLYASLNKFINTGNLNDSKIIDELTFIDKDFRKFINLNETNRKKLLECKERLKNLNIEVKSMKTMLEKSSNSWQKFSESYNILNNWLENQKDISDISNIDFSNYQKYQKLHSQFNESANFLLQVSDLFSLSKIKQNLVSINKLWKSYQEKFKDTIYEQYLKFYECEHSLNMVNDRLSKIENLLIKSVKINSIYKYQEELEKSLKDLDFLETNLKLVSKLLQRIDLKKEKQKINNVSDTIRLSHEKINYIKICVMKYQKNTSQIQPDLNLIVENLENIEFWIIEGENLVKHEPEQFNFDEILLHIEKQKKHFDEFKNYNNAIKTKIQQLQFLKSAIPQNIDSNELNNKLLKIKDLMNNLNAKRLKWEELFKEQQSLWRNFHSKTKQLELWITDAQRIVIEKNDDFNFLIQKHKEFFENINKDILNDFLKSGEKLFCIKNDKDKLEIKNLMDTLEGQWKMITLHAPIRLLKLEFKFLESMLKKELFDANDELNKHILALASNHDAENIYKRFHEKFKNSNFFPLCESYLEQIKKCVLELAENKIEDRSFIEEAFQDLNSQWINLTQKIEDLSKKIQAKLNKREIIDRNLTVLDSWLFEVESASKNLFDHNLTSISEYSRALEKMQILLQDLSPNRKLLNALLYEVNSLSKNLNETTSSFVDNLRSKFEQLVDNNLKNIEFRSNYLKAILSIAQKLDIISGKISNLSCSSARRFMAEEDDSSLHSAVEEQKSILDQMRMYEQEVDELKLEAKSLANDGHLQMPTIVYEKLNCIQETIRHNISEELDRRSSLLEIKQLNDFKENKIQQMDQNLKNLETIIFKKANVKINEDSFTSFFDCTLNDEALNENYDEEKIDYFLKKIAKCKDIISRNSLIFEEMSKPITQDDSRDDRLENIRFSIKRYDYQIDQIVDLYEKSLAKQDYLEQRLKNLKNDLTSILKNFDLYTENERGNCEPELVFDSLNIQHENILADIEKIKSLKIDVNKLKIDQKNESANNRNFVVDKHLPVFLLDFVNLVESEDSIKQNKLDMKINEYLNDLNMVEDNYRNKLNKILLKLNNQVITKKQKKLDHLTNTLNIQMDTLKGLSNEKENSMDLMNEDYDDLRKESDNILLERMSLDDSQSTPNQSRKDLIVLQETTCRKIVRTIESVIKDDHRYEVYRVLPVNGVEDDDQFDENTIDCILQSEEKIHNQSVIQYDESIVIDHDFENNLKFEKDRLELERAEFEKTIYQRQLYDQEMEERENLIRIERERLEMEKSQLEKSKIELETKERIESERNEKLRIEREKLEREKQEIEKQEREKIREINSMIRLERENLERDKMLLEQSKMEKFEAERAERERLERESQEVKRMIKLEREKLEAEKKELEKKRIEKEKEQKELEILRQQRMEINRAVELERSRIENERLELEKKEIMEKKERERIEAERKALERLAVENEKLEIEQRKHEIEALEQQRVELERLASLERQRIERERLEKERLEQEKLDLERKKAEAELLEKERAELERRARVERERLEKERLDFEKEKLEIERRRLEKEKLEKERFELEQIYQLEQERLNKEKAELERQRHEKELLEKEKFELEKQRLERQKLESQRKQLEIEYKGEKERIEQERLCLENLEKERLELKRQEIERVKLIENERQERLKQERLKIEKIRAERQQREFMERERHSKEQAEAERILKLKLKEKEEADLAVKLEQERRAEIDRIENSIRREKLEKLEQERLRNQQKFKLELKLKEICERLNSLKAKILDLKINNNSVEQIEQFEIELNRLDDQVLDLYNKSISLENRILNDSCNNEYYLFDSLDNAALTQFELLRSFLSYLKSQIDHKKNQILRQTDLKIRLKNLYENLDRYIQLADKINCDNKGRLCIDNQLDLEQRIQSMETIETSIDECFKQIADLSKDLKDNEFNRDLTTNRANIDQNTIQPLLMSLSKLKHFLNQWKLFDERFESFCDYLYQCCNFEKLIEMMKRDSILCEVNFECCDLETDLEHFLSTRTLMIKKLAESDELLLLGTNLFDFNQNPPVVCSAASKKFFQVKQLIGDVSKFLDEKCSILRYAIKENKKFESIRSEFNQIKCQIEDLMTSEHSSDINNYKQKYEIIIEIKKKLRELIDQKDREDNFECLDTSYSESRIHSLKKKINPSLKLELENTVHYLMDAIQFLEVDYYQKIMKNLPSRNSLNDLQNWICDANQRIKDIYLIIETDRPIDMKKLELLKKNISLLREELFNKNEIEFKFCSETIENEVKQGFFDLSIQETSAQIKTDLEKLNQKINSSMETVDISILKLNEFDKTICQLKSWLDNKIKQAELEKVTKFKTNFEEKTILMDEMKNYTSIEEEKTLAKQIAGLKLELDDIRKFWLDERTLNHTLIRSLIYDHIFKELEVLKNNLENIEVFNQVKIQNNFTSMKQNFSLEINELNFRLQDELNFVLSGKMTNLTQYCTAICNLKSILDILELKRTEMENNLKKFQLDLQSNELPIILNLSQNTDLLVDSNLKNFLLNNLNNRELENKAKDAIYQAEIDMIENWKKYDQILEDLLLQLEKSQENLSHNIYSIDCIFSSVNLLNKNNLYEKTTNEMVKFKGLFSNLVHLGDILSPLNENLKAQILQNKKSVELKLEELSNLAEKLSNKLEQAGQEQKNFLKLVENLEQVLIRSENLIKDYVCTDNLENKFSSDIKKLSYDIESYENELRNKMSDFKNLKIKDSESIEKIYNLTSQCSTQLNKLRDLRIKLLDQLQERNYLAEIKLNDLETFLNTLETFISKKFGNLFLLDEENLLDRYINCIKYLEAKDLELSKWDFSMEHLDIEIDEISHKKKIVLLKDRIEKFRKLIRSMNDKDGLFECFLKLKDISLGIENAEFKLSSDEEKLIKLKEDFLYLQNKIENQNNNSKIIDFEFFYQNCLKYLETKLNTCIINFMEKNDLEKNFRSKLIKTDATIKEIDLKLISESNESIKDLSGYEKKLNNLKHYKSIITDNQFRCEIEDIQNLADRLETGQEFQQLKIKYLDLCCDIDKLINKYEYEYDHLRQIINKSQQLLNLIKESHEDLNKFKINKAQDQIESEYTIDQMLNFIKFNVLNRLKENELFKNEIFDLHSKYLEKSSNKSIDLIKEIVDKLFYEWDLINERCINKIKKFEIFKTKLADIDRKLNKIREYSKSMENYVRYEMFNNFDMTDMKQIMTKKIELENLLNCLLKKDQNTETVFKQALNVYKTNSQQLALITSLKARWDDLKFVVRDKILKLSNIWLFLNDQIENFYVILKKTEEFYNSILLDVNFQNFNESSLNNFEFSKYTSYFQLIGDLYVTINEDNKLIKYLNESFINFSKYVHDFESSQCLEKIREKLIEINSRWDALHNDIALKIRMARKHRSKLNDIIDFPLNVTDLLVWTNEMNLLIKNLEHLSAKEIIVKVNEIEDIKREIYNQTNLLFKNEHNLKIESSLIDQIKDLMKRILRIDAFVQQSTLTNLTRFYSPESYQTSDLISLFEEF